MYIIIKYSLSALINFFEQFKIKWNLKYAHTYYNVILILKYVIII